MKGGIARKLITTYFIIIIATVISGIFCLYVLRVNLNTNSEMRYVTMPSLENLKTMRAQMQEVKKLMNTWVYISNNKDQARLEQIIDVEYPNLNRDLKENVTHWKNANELNLIRQISVNNARGMDSVKTITALLFNPESFTNDNIVDRAAEISRNASRIININDKLYKKLIETKERNLVLQQNLISSLLDSLYVIVVLTILVVILVSYIASQYSRKNIVVPLLNLNKTILNMAKGEVVAIDEVKRNDEIGQMQNAIHQMINGIIREITFAEQIGQGNYSAEFSLLSEKDKLGTALMTMRSNLQRTNEKLLEHEKRLIDAQKLARVGNYFYNLETGELQSSQTLDDILGIEDQQKKAKLDWREPIVAPYHEVVAEGSKKAIKEHTKFTESYLIRRFNDGKECWVRTIGEYNYNYEGRAVSMFGTIQDITESKLMELELNNSYNVAREQNNRLLNFSYIVSHNLRMHAVNIQSLLELINEAETETEKTELMTHVKTTSGQLNETLHHLNDVVAMQSTVSLEVKSVSLNTYVKNAIGLLKTKIDEKQATIINHISDDLMINYNPAYLDSILLNFLSNAVKYSNPDRKPEVTLSFHPAGSASAYTGVLEIADNGIGIDLKNNREKLFGMYKTFHGNKDAKGIGLFMTKYQIEAMGGQVTVESKVGQGTKFRITIK
jgi:PAS domain S-box-containing protein